MIILSDSVEAQLSKRAVSSAAPSLSPERRYQTTKAQFSKFKQDYYAEEGFGKARALNVVDNGRSIANENAKMGKVLSNVEFEKRLKTLNANLHIEPSLGNENVLGLYLLGVWGTLPNGEKLTKKFVCRIDRGYLTEGDVHKLKMVRRLVETHPPVYEEIPELDPQQMRRGWRSVLAVLLKLRAVTESGILRVFGQPSWSSRLWQENLS